MLNRPKSSRLLSGRAPRQASASRASDQPPGVTSSSTSVLGQWNTQSLSEKWLYLNNVTQSCWQIFSMKVVEEADLAPAQDQARDKINFLHSPRCFGFKKKLFKLSNAALTQINREIMDKSAELVGRRGLTPEFLVDWIADKRGLSSDLTSEIKDCHCHCYSR